MDEGRIRCESGNIGEKRCVRKERAGKRRQMKNDLVRISRELEKSQDEGGPKGGLPVGV